MRMFECLACGFIGRLSLQDVLIPRIQFLLFTNKKQSPRNGAQNSKSHKKIREWAGPRPWGGSGHLFKVAWLYVISFGSGQGTPAIGLPMWRELATGNTWNTHHHHHHTGSSCYRKSQEYDGRKKLFGVLWERYCRISCWGERNRDTCRMRTIIFCIRQFSLQAFKECVLTEKETIPTLLIAERNELQQLVQSFDSLCPFPPLVMAIPHVDKKFSVWFEWRRRWKVGHSPGRQSACVIPSRNELMNIATVDCRFWPERLRSINPKWFAKRPSTAKWTHHINLKAIWLGFSGEYSLQLFDSFRNSHARVATCKRQVLRLRLRWHANPVCSA